MHKLAFCLRAGLRLSFQLTLDAGVFQDKKRYRGSRTIVCHECTCIRSVYKYLSVQKSKLIVSTWLQTGVGLILHPRFSALFQGSRCSAWLSNILYSSLHLWEWLPPCCSWNISESDMFFLFLFIGKRYEASM